MKIQRWSVDSVDSMETNLHMMRIADCASASPCPCRILFHNEELLALECAVITSCSKTQVPHRGLSRPNSGNEGTAATETINDTDRHGQGLLLHCPFEPNPARPDLSQAKPEALNLRSASPTKNASRSTPPNASRLQRLTNEFSN